MTLEQENFLDQMENEGIVVSQDTEDTPKPEIKMADEEDGLSYKCETCMDRPGGCAQCGYGRGEEAA